MTNWLPIITALVALTATIVGWLLNQLGQVFTFHRERKKAIARSIYGMLQIRDRVQILPEVVRILSSEFGIPAPHRALLLAAMENVVFTEDDIGKEFEASLVVLSEHDPISAARLRSSNQIVPILKRIRQLVLANPVGAGLWNELEMQIFRYAFPQLDEAILEIAQLHGRRMAKDVRAKLAKKADVPKEVLDSIASAIRLQMQADQAQAAQLQKAANDAPRRQPRVPIWQRDPTTNPQRGSA